MSQKKLEVLSGIHFEYCREINAEQLIQQIGWMNVLAISGGRVEISDAAVKLPVSNGYAVLIQLNWNDTYTVRRILKRGNKVFVKGTVEGVHCEEIGEVAYYASCFRSHPDFAQEVQIA